MTLAIPTADIIGLLRKIVSRRDDFLEGVTRIAIAITDDENLQSFLVRFEECIDAEADPEKSRNGLAGLLAIGIVTGIVANAQELRQPESVQ